MFGSLVGNVVTARGTSDNVMSLTLFFSSEPKATVAKPDSVLVTKLSSSIDVIFFCIGSVELFGSFSTVKVLDVLGLVSDPEINPLEIP